jgi:L-ascorbate metabolism protein UlaG (beta-lactamase superfamily)
VKGPRITIGRGSLLAGLALLSGVVSAQAPGASAGDGVVVTPIIHASVQIEYGRWVVQVDPWSRGDLSQAKAADLILVTDDNPHHLDVDAIRRLRKPGAPIVIPAVGRDKLPDGDVLGNGQTGTFAGLSVEAVAMYDMTPGEPSHPQGRGNGYVLTLGAHRLYFAGVTECVPEVRALKNIEIAFLPMNLPLGRMTPAAAAECARAIAPRVVYPYHYDQAYVARLGGRGQARQARAPTPHADDGIAAFKEALRGAPIEVREGNWYP